MALSKEDKDRLAKWEGLYRLSQTPEYIDYLKPLLKDAFTNKWPDPAESKTPEEFHKQYTEHYGRAMAYKDLYNTIEGAGKTIEGINDQIKKRKGNGI